MRESSLGLVLASGQTHHSTFFFFKKAFKRFLKSFGSVADSAGASEQLLLDTVVDLLEKNFSVGDERLGVASSFFFPNLKSR